MADKFEWGQKIKRGMDLEPHPSTYTDDKIDESPWAFESKKPWYKKVFSWFGGGKEHDKFKATQVDPLTASQQRTGDAGIAEDYFSSGDTADQVSEMSAPGPGQGVDEVPDFIAKQMAKQKKYTDPEEHALEELTRETSAEKALAQQTPSLTPTNEKAWWDFSSDDGEDLTHVGGTVASVQKEEALDAVADKILDKAEGEKDDPYAGLTQNEFGIWLDKDGFSPRHLGMQIPNKKKKDDFSSLSVFDEEDMSRVGSDKSPSLLASLDDDIGPDHHDSRGESIDQTKSWWDSMGSSGGGKVTPNQRIAAGLIKDIFAEPEQAPQQQISAAPLTPGKSFDMSYLKNKRPKRDRYRNQGLLA